LAVSQDDGNYSLFIIRIGEVALKTGKPRIEFERRLFSNINNFLENRGVGGRASKDRTGRAVARIPAGKENLAERVLSKVFGVTSFSKALSFEYSDLPDLCEKALSISEREFQFAPGKSFAIRARVPGKSSRQFDSQILGREVGAKILLKFPFMKVDLDNPDIEISIEAREDGRICYLFSSTVEGAGGLPYGSEGPVLVLLDGTEESALAGILAAKRGCSLDFLSFSGDERRNAESIGKIMGFLPQKKVLLFPADSMDEALAKSGALALVLGRTQPPEAREFPGFLEIAPLELVEESALARMADRYFGDLPVRISEKKSAESSRRFLEVKW